MNWINKLDKALAKKIYDMVFWRILNVTLPELEHEIVIAFNACENYVVYFPINVKTEAGVPLKYKYLDLHEYPYDEILNLKIPGSECMLHDTFIETVNETHRYSMLYRYYFWDGKISNSRRALKKFVSAIKNNLEQFYDKNYLL